MTTVILSVPAPKEVVDALVAIDGFVQKLVAGEPVTQIVIDELGVALKLAGEVAAIPAEVQGAPDQALDAGALFGRRVVYRLMKLPVAPVVVS